MALFKRKQKPAQKPVKITHKLFLKEFTQSGTFRGYRRVKLTTYGIDQVQETLAHFAQSGYDFKGCTITLEGLAVEGVFVDELMRVVNVFVNDQLIGCVYDSPGSDQYSMLTEYEFDKAHLLVENGTVYLFVHYPGAAPLKVSTEVK